MYIFFSINCTFFQVTDGTPGFVKCDKADCGMCQHVSPTTTVKSTVTGFLYIMIECHSAEYFTTFSRSICEDQLQSWLSGQACCLHHYMFKVQETVCSPDPQESGRSIPGTFDNCQQQNYKSAYRKTFHTSRYLQIHELFTYMLHNPSEYYNSFCVQKLCMDCTSHFH